MKEVLLHYIWKNALFNTKEYIADTGEKVQIIQPGKHSTDQGPDFTESQAEIAGTKWVGNIEIHKRASDWYVHKHHENPDYDNVILHVVAENDKECFNSKGRQIPTIIITYDPELERNYQELINSEREISCLPQIKELDTSRIGFWLSALAVDRLQAKTSAIEELFKSTGNSWEEAFYIHLARSFGLKINALPFELLTKSLPLKTLLQEPGNLLRTEALLFGQAGFLDHIPCDEHTEKLMQEYQYQQKKYKLKPMQKHLWKFLRLRPLNFPTVRIAQFACMLAKGNTMFSEVMALKTPADFVNYFSCEVSAYWKNHYTFGNSSVATDKKLGKSTVYLLAINTVIPFMFYYGSHKNNEALKEQAIRLLEQLPAEKNHTITQWTAAGMTVKSAVQSQALLELTQNYCKPKQCLQCQIGHYVLNHYKTCNAKV